MYFLPAFFISFPNFFSPSYLHHVLFCLLSPSLKVTARLETQLTCCRKRFKGFVEFTTAWLVISEIFLFLEPPECDWQNLFHKAFKELHRGKILSQCRKCFLKSNSNYTSKQWSSFFMDNLWDKHLLILKRSFFRKVCNDSQKNNVRSKVKYIIKPQAVFYWNLSPPLNAIDPASTYQSFISEVFSLASWISDPLMSF